MSESANEPTGTETDPEANPAGTETDQEDAEAQGLLDGMSEQPTQEELAQQLDDWKARARQWETRSKANASAAKELADIKKAGMTELEKAQAERDEAQRERDEAQGNHHRVMAAAAHNLPVDLIDDLGSGTEDEINERAERFASAIETRARELTEQAVEAMRQGRNGMPMGARPIESLRPGAQPASGGTPATADEWFRQLLQNR